MLTASDSSKASGRGADARDQRPLGLVAVAIPLAAGLGLRLWMLKSLFEISGDALIYGDLAKNLLLHGRFDLTLPSGEIYPTLIRLPGYPLFLALCFRIFGVENYFAPACLQIALDLAGCLLLADVVRRIAPSALRRNAALATLWLAALCPFTASYTAFPMSEVPTLFSIALALHAIVRFCERPRWAPALWFTFAITSIALLRPDGALVAVVLVPAILLGAWRGEGADRTAYRKLAPIAITCALLALAPFVAWSWRNWQTFHVFEPLAPRLANDPGEDPDLGWVHWVKSWCLDFDSTYQIYWNVPWDRLDVSKLPSRAFDSADQYRATVALARDYNDNGMEITPEIDARFEALARQRIAANPMRYYVYLPVGRMIDMWLRPRIENLPIDLDWWNYARHHRETEFSWAYVGLNVLYLLLGIAGLALRPRFWLPMLAYIVLRSALLLTIEAPEARYTLECFPMLFVCAGVALASARLHFVKLKALPGND